MSSAVLLRKKLLSILQEKILPDLRSRNTPRLVMAHLPLNVPPEVGVRELSHPPLRDAAASRNYPDGKMWSDVHMHASRFPALFCVVEGEVDLLMGVTTSMLSGLARRARREQPGGYIFSLPAPSYFLVPPDVPQKTGALSPWQRAEPHIGRACFFHVRILPVGALCNFSTLINAVYEVQYSLLIQDAQLVAILGILIDELSTPSPDVHIAQAQLLTLMLRLQRGMSTQALTMTDGLYSRFPDSDPQDLQAHLLHDPLIRQAHEYIRLHLHEPLNPASIARQVRRTPVQLNRLFKTNTGLSTMNYVTRLRMESAQLLLRNSDLSVQEISRLVGFRQLPYFCRSFHSHTGCTPLKFRQREKPLSPRTQPSSSQSLSS